MIILGIKLTHDGAVALIDKGQLIFCYEMEKINNSMRYASFCITIEELDDILKEYGYSLEDVDRIVIDGWTAIDWDKMIGGVEQRGPLAEITWKGQPVVITTNELAGYGHFVTKEENVLTPHDFEFKQQRFGYRSYLHVSGHIAAAYCSSSFSARREDAYILIWDGGMPPQLFYYRHRRKALVNLGILFPLAGYIYSYFSHAFEPFSSMEQSLSIAGKAMAYMALGKVDPRILDRYRSIFGELEQMSSPTKMNFDVVAVLTPQFIKLAKEFGKAGGFPDTDMLTTFQEFLKELLIEELSRKVKEYPGYTNNLCLSGGCALNIKWNSEIRKSGIFREVWVPPFPNDSGSAIGIACCEMMVSDGITSLGWNVYSGPQIRSNHGANDLVNGYQPAPCSLEELAEILHTNDVPVVFLNGRAELGPRALGSRSILAPAVSAQMKDTLNRIKGRENYRPVAPICLEEHAPTIFTPGSSDPYMLFEHQVKENWIDKVPAIRHLDGTARLQTVNTGNGKIYELLMHYYRRSGIPLLCNTSANFNGKGFFPDVQSAMRWGKANFIWHNDILFTRVAPAS
jgi:carbamoyltransferase